MNQLFQGKHFRVERGAYPDNYRVVARRGSIVGRYRVLAIANAHAKESEDDERGRRAATWRGRLAGLARRVSGRVITKGKFYGDRVRGRA